MRQFYESVLVEDCHQSDSVIVGQNFRSLAAEIRVGVVQPARQVSGGVGSLRCRRHRLIRLIPACAGESLALPRPLASGTADPRVCGGIVNPRLPVLPGQG